MASNLSFGFVCYLVYSFIYDLVSFFTDFEDAMDFCSFFTDFEGAWVLGEALFSCILSLLPKR